MSDEKKNVRDAYAFYAGAQAPDAIRAQAGLTANEVKVLEGLLGGRTLAALGGEMGLSKERIRQIQRKALIKIAHRVSDKPASRQIIP